jgi:heat-inducible transcriptional repressor
MELTPRKRKILKAVVESFVSTAQPVGSKSIFKNYDLGISSATIRKEMSELEDMGYLTHPYTSAGRVPTHKGYRVYVDSLKGEEDLSLDKKIFVINQYKKALEIEKAIECTSKILSDITNYTSLISTPKIYPSTFKHIDLIPFGTNQAVVVVILGSGLVYKKIIRVPDLITPDVLSRVAKVLNEKLFGLNLIQIKKVLVKEVEEEISSLTKIFKGVIEDLIKQTLEIENVEKIHLEGIPNILSQPEFQDPEKMRLLLELLRKEKVLSSILSHSLTALIGEVKIIIGNESNMQEMESCSVVSTPYRVYGMVLGTLGVLGPIRMQYSRVIAAVKFTGRALSDVLNRISWS